MRCGFDRHNSSPSSNSPAFTLVECLVAVGVIGMVASLTLPAVQSARQAARSAACLNNLRQIGLGVNGYVSDYNCFPPAILKGSDKVLTFFSAQTRLLPYLGHAEYFNSLNYDAGAVPIEVGLRRPTARDLWRNSPNETVYHSQVGLFLCPSDGGPFANSGCNYRGNAGVGPAGGVSAEHPDSGNGIFPEHEFVSASRVTDGLSHTIAFSERLRGSGRDSPISPSRDFYMSPGFRTAYTADLSMLLCRIAARGTNHSAFLQSGEWWFWTGRERTLYDHTQAPNGYVPDCLHGRVRTAMAMATARSFHSGRVNCSMGDGSARSVSQSINLPVWRALGTRNGGELTD